MKKKIGCSSQMGIKYHMHLLDKNRFEHLDHYDLKCNECESYHQTGQCVGVDYIYEEIIEVKTDGLAEKIRCVLCTNTTKYDRCCDECCMVDDNLFKKVMKVIEDNTIN